MRLNIPVAMFALVFGLAGCSHVQIWKSPDYVHPGSIEYNRLAERLDVLYSMSCQTSDSAKNKQYIINGTRVVLKVPNSRECAKAIPYAICYSSPDQDPAVLCRRVDR